MVVLGIHLNVVTERFGKKVSRVIRENMYDTVLRIVNKSFANSLSGSGGRLALI